MKTMFIVFVAACFVGTALIQRAQSAFVLSPEHQKLEIWVGDWAYEGVAQESPLGPAGKFTGTYNARLILGGRNIEFCGEETGPTGTIQWVEIDSYDVAGKRYHWNGFGSDGSMQDITYTIDGSTVAYWGTSSMGAMQFKVRGTSVFAADRMSSVDKREISMDGKTWKLVSEGKTTKVLSKPEIAAGVEKELIQLENDWAKAYLSGDVAALAQIEADGWAFTDAEGAVITKAEDIADLASKAFVATVFEMSDLKVKLFGEVGVVMGRQTVKATYKGKDASALYQITDVWQRRDGRWQAIASHMSKVVPPTPVVKPPAGANTRAPNDGGWTAKD